MSKLKDALQYALKAAPDELVARTAFNETWLRQVSKGHKPTTSDIENRLIKAAKSLGWREQPFPYSKNTQTRTPKESITDNSALTPL